MAEAVRSKSFSSLPFILTPNISASSIPTISYDTARKSPPTVFPSIREASFGESLGLRSRFQENVGISGSGAGSGSGSHIRSGSGATGSGAGSAHGAVSSSELIGSPDLVHWGKYYGTTSSHFTHNEFTKERTRSSAGGSENKGNDDGYVGYFHYVNGITFDYLQEDIEEYVLQLVGLEVIDDQYFFKKDHASSDSFSPSKREMVVTYCTYNIFNKSDFRARFVIHPNGSSRKNAVQIDKSYQIVPNPSNTNYNQQGYRKAVQYNSSTIKQCSGTYWEELRASQLVRLFYQLDNPSHQLTGLVSYSSFVDTKRRLFNSIKTIIKFLGKGFMTGADLSWGLSNTCGNKGEQSRKTNHYRNNLVNTLIRLVQLDLSGDANDYAISEIQSMWSEHEWDYVILKILKVQKNSNIEQEYLERIREVFTQKDLIYTTQSGLILLEQVKLLISKKSYEQALVIAKKSIEILPLDFECWYNLALCYILNKDFEKALLVMNSLPIITNPKQIPGDMDDVSGVRDTYSSTFIQRLNQSEEVISEKTFKSYFPLPKVPSEKYSSIRSRSATGSTSKLDEKRESELIYEGSIDKMWNQLFLFSHHLRHPINGNFFYQSPLMNSSTRELSSVDPALIKLCGSGSLKSAFATQSSGCMSSSILDFHRKSTWGRSYELLSFFVAVVGWDMIVELKERVFRSTLKKEKKEFVVDNGDDTLEVNKSFQFPAKPAKSTGPHVPCETWLEQLFLIIYEDLRVLMVILANDKNQQHSALEWEMLGLLGWGVKYNLEESISSLMTSVMGTSVEGGFDYFGTVQLLEIYDELILSDTTTDTIDLFHDDYNLKFLSNKLILKSTSNFFDSFVKSLEANYFTLDFVLLNLMKLISWELRWYQYVPNYLVTKILTKLILKYDSIFISTSLRVVFEKNKKSIKFLKKKSTSLGIFSSFLGGESSKSKVSENFEFIDDDTIFDYTERVIRWIDSLRE